MNKADRIRKYLGIGFIVVGIFVIVFPIAGRLIAEYQQKQMIKEFYMDKEAAQKELGKLDQTFQETNTEAGQESLDTELSGITVENNEIGNVEETNAVLSAMTLGKAPTIIGIMSIPKIELKTPIAEGADLDILKYAVGRMKSTGKLCEIGNAAVAGHRSHSFGVYFNRLDELAIGDVITVETKDKSLDYIVYDKLLVKPDEVSVLKGSSKEKILTLITCDPVYNPTHRLIIHAKAE